MSSPLLVQRNVALRAHNTFGIEAAAAHYIRIVHQDDLRAVAADAGLMAMPRLVLGGGSNIVLTGDFPGLVLHMCTSGIEVTGETRDAVLVTAAAGENWHRLVDWTLQHGPGGLENLSLIPGSVGASPIQNIGAYGVELKDRFHSLRMIDMQSGAIRSLQRHECGFSYRDSIFKQELRDRAVILDVTLALPRRWQACIAYAELSNELQARGVMAPTARQVAHAVIAIRQRKLPDPATIGNAGSFFKNPLVGAARRDELVAKHPELVSYPQPDGSYKLAAGWLIDQCGWKGRSLGAAGVYEKQALVLINRGGATGAQILQLAATIRADVAGRFGVELEPEPVLVPGQ